MRRLSVGAITVGCVGVVMAGGTALARADDSDRRSTVGGFELEIDPELDAEFGERPVNAVRAAAIVARDFPGARVTEAELDERGGGPVWEMTFLLGGAEREVEVDAVTGSLLRDDDGGGVRGREGADDDDD